MEADKNRELVPHSIEVAAAFHGPLPPPDMLRGYEETLPGLAERIVTEAETESAHRREMETTALAADISLARRGQAGAWMIGFAFLIAAVVLVVSGNAVIGGVLGVVELLLIAASFAIRQRLDLEALRGITPADPPPAD